jgi:8-oxo-dGTP pyrophosphatase MutT (NUDIX family)
MKDGGFYKIRKVLKNRLPDINMREEFFNSAVLLPLIKLGKDIHILFQKRHENIRQGGEVSFPGGGIDFKKDKTALDAALRESEEELGIPKKNINIIGALDTIVSPVGGIVECFAGILKIGSLEELKINIDEVEKVFTIPLSYFIKNKPDEYKVELKVFPYSVDENGNKTTLLPVKEIGLQDIYSKPWGGKQYSVHVYNTKPEIVWGITARFILDLTRRLI